MLILLLVVLVLLPLVLVFFAVFLLLRLFVFTMYHSESFVLLGQLGSIGIRNEASEENPEVVVPLAEVLIRISVIGYVDLLRKRSLTF